MQDPRWSLRAGPGEGFFFLPRFLSAFVDFLLVTRRLWTLPGLPAPLFQPVTPEPHFSRSLLALPKVNLHSLSPSTLSRQALSPSALSLSFSASHILLDLILVRKRERERGGERERKREMKCKEALYTHRWVCQALRSRETSRACHSHTL